jgi:hypothetical protein
MFGVVVFGGVIGLAGLLYWLIGKAAELEAQRAVEERDRLDRIVRASHDMTNITRGQIDL